MRLPPTDHPRPAARRRAPVRSLVLAVVALSIWLGGSGVPPRASAAESLNITLRGAFEPPASNRLFGDVAAVGDFLLLATFQPWDESPGHGLYVIDASRPDSLALAAFLPTTRATRDISIADTLALIALEPAGAPGDPALLLLSIADPRAPRVIGAFGADSASMAHNAFFAPPYAYMANSRSQDLRIIDFSDPSAPFEVGRWKLDPPAIMHDVMVSDTLAFLSYWTGGLVVLSVADPARPYQVGRFAYPGAHTHSVVLSPDRKTAYVTDEEMQPPFGGMHILDISDLSNIVEVGAWRCAGFDDSIHNLCVQGNRLYVSYYTCGVRILDIASPREPREIAYYDMDTPGSTTGGFWGVHPRAGTGLVYAGHIHKGAVVLEERAFRSWRVAAGGGADFETIQSAIDAAGAGDTIRVEAGTYAEAISLPGGMSLVGSGASTTVIDAGGRGRALTVIRGDNATRVAGLSLTGGRSPDGEGGGGMLLFETDAVIESVSVFGNRADGLGGGVLIEGGGPELRGVELRGVRFLANNAASGGAVAIISGAAAAPVRLLGCEMLDNDATERGGGLFSSSAKEVFLERCRIARNSAGAGAGVWGTNGYIDLMNCLVAWNRADRAGGGLGAAATYYHVENSVVADNTAPAGAALWGEGSVSLEADILDAVFTRNAGASTFEASGLAPVRFTHSDFFANGGALAAGGIAPPPQSDGNLFEDPRFVEPTWEELDYLPGLESPLIDAGNDYDPTQADLDSTLQDIGIGGGPLSGWVAPRLPPNRDAVALDNYDVCICWSRSAETPRIVAYRDTLPSVPPDSAHRFNGPFDDFVRAGNNRFEGFIDTTYSSTDTVGHYRVVALDERGRSGSPSGVLSVSLANLPPELSLYLHVPHSSNSADSLQFELNSNERLGAAALSLNGAPIPFSGNGSSSTTWDAFIARPDVEYEVTVEATDVYGAVTADTLRGDFILLAPDAPLSARSAYGTISISADVEDEHLLHIRRVETPDLPGAFVPISDAFTIDDMGPGRAWIDSADVQILGPDALLADERIALVQPFYYDPTALYEPARRETTDGVRTARVPYGDEALYSILLLVAGDAPPAEHERFALSQPIPNPSRAGSSVLFEITRWGGESVLLEIYDMSGRMVRRVHDGPLPNGRYSVTWDGRDESGDLVSSGHYIVRGRAGGIGSSRRLTLVR